MKIAFVAWCFPNTWNTFILNEIVELLRQENDLTIVSLFRPSNQLVHRCVHDHKLLSRTVYLDDYGLKGASVEKSLKKFQRDFSIRQLQALVNLAQVLHNERFDVIHADFANLGATAAMILSKLCQIPFTFEAHALDLFVNFRFAREKLKNASFVITESNYHRDFIASRYKAQKEHIRINHLAPDLRSMDYVERTPQDENLVVSACRLHPIKGIKYALRAVASAKEKFPSLKYRIIGAGPQLDSLKKEAYNLGLLNSVELIGSVTNTEVFRLTEAASVFLHPSVIDCNGDSDGTPTAICEAMYLGIPVISSRIRAIPELIDDGLSGILTEPKDVNAISEGLCKLLRDKKLRQSMGQAGKTKILSEFNLETNTEALINIFAEVCGRRTKKRK